MNKKEVGEIRRRIKPEHNNIGHIYGCFVNVSREIVAYIDESAASLSQEETEKYLALFRKVLSGSIGQKLLDISFATKQVMDSEEIKLLSAMRKSELKDQTLLDSFYKCIIDAIDPGENGYCILLAQDAYDVPHFGKDGRRDEESSEVFRYMLCAVCPVKPSKAQFGFSTDDNRFMNIPGCQLMSAPELGFMYPAFDERAANIYNALFYSRSTKDDHEDFINAVFHARVPMSAEAQREAFNNVITETLDKDCSFTLMKSVNEQLNERILVHKESRDPEQLLVSPEDIGSMLETAGAAPEQVESFCAKCAEEFGDNALLSPANIIDSRNFRLETEEVRISVDPQHSHLVETRIIDGRKYIMIAADSGVELNGLSVSIE